MVQITQKTSKKGSLPFSIRIKDESELCEQQAREEMLLSKRDRELKHCGHPLILNHTGKC